ncbi:MAG: DUF2934 domain-containing protein [Candidatus Omnitrophica bacterium]|jgi:hypothetical protein|nr:DUF2934 domain-containing protein [Candidatus Omnitrophota bacterium]MDD5691097.1 DUF2934 domain-containing protein [Candidatus Omnitrophota bacterium]
MANNSKNKKKGSALLFGESITEKIRRRAQELYEKRGCVPGNDWADWFEAERQVKSELNKDIF